MVKENKVLIFICVITSKNEFMDSNEDRLPMLIDPIAHIWLVNGVVIQDFDSHQELNELDEPLLSFVIHLSIMLSKIVEGG